MSSSNHHNCSPYNLRPRKKIVPANVPKISLTRLEKSQTQKIIDERAKLPFEELEGAGERFMIMSGEELTKMIRARNEACGAIYVPPTPVSDEEQARSREEQNLLLAETGLAYLNDPANGDAKYDLVRPIAARFFISCKYGPRGIRHCNFEAKLQNDPEAKAQLFFLETVEKGPGTPKKVTHCCCLGPSGSKAAATGLNGCRKCSKINHPKNRHFFTI